MPEAKRKTAGSGERGLRRATAAARGRPEVIVEFLFDCGVFSIAVRNIGDRPAQKVSVAFNKRIVGVGGAREISALALFKSIEFLGPCREIVTFLDTSDSYFRRQQPTNVSARVSYSDSDGSTYEATIINDLEIYRELGYVATFPGTNHSPKAS
jgi:hypothetical protein